MRHRCVGKVVQLIGTFYHPDAVIVCFSNQHDEFCLGWVANKGFKSEDCGGELARIRLPIWHASYRQFL